MQLNNLNRSDLDYLAELGINNAIVNDADLNYLKVKIRNRSLSYNSGNYFYFISLIVGIFIGISVFFTIFNTQHYYPTKSKIVTSNKLKLSTNTNASIVLDTINFVQENFVKTFSTKTKLSDTLIDVNENLNNAIEASTIPIATLPKNEITEAQIKYFANASLFYLHDLKITEYSTLYFKLNKFISLNSQGGLTAAYANKEEFKQSINFFEDTRPYYLHQAISDAMLQFKLKRFDECIVILNDIMMYNPNDINCKFYYGMCLYNKKNYSVAIKYLEFCINNANNSFLQEAEFYKAMCLFELENKEEANKLFKKITSEGGFYSDKAKLLESL